MCPDILTALGANSSCGTAEVTQKKTLKKHDWRKCEGSRWTKITPKIETFSNLTWNLSQYIQYTKKGSKLQVGAISAVIFLCVGRQLCPTFLVGESHGRSLVFQSKTPFPCFDHSVIALRISKKKRIYLDHSVRIYIYRESFIYDSLCICIFVSEKVPETLKHNLLED